MATSSAADASSSTENTIRFTETHQIVRNLPRSLAGKLKVEYWNKFCDDCDQALALLGRVQTLERLLWLAICLFAILAAGGWQWADENLAAYYSFVGPIILALFFLLCHVSQYAQDKAASNIRNACAEVSNYDKDLTLELNVDEEPECWYIAITLFNDATATAPDAEDIEAAVPVVVVSEVAEAVPVVASSTTTSTQAAAAVAPTKYVKDKTTGKLTLNPEYRKWMSGN